MAPQSTAAQLSLPEPAEVEEWRPVVGYEGWYEVSSLGRVKRVMASMGTRPGKILRPFKAGHSTKKRLCIKLRRRNVVSVGIQISHLVADAFLGPCPDKLEIDHVDGDCWNNRPGNLEYVTHKVNQERASALGLMTRGEKVSWSRLTEPQVREIRTFHHKMLLKDVAAQYGVSMGAIWGIWNGANWKHVT